MYISEELYIKNFKSILVAGRDVFETALVDSIITIITTQEHSTIDYLNMDNETKKICFIRSVDKSVLDAPYALDIIFSNSIDTIAKLEKSFTTLGHYYKCENACATSDCYKLKEILYSLDCEEDFSEATHYKVINTGTIGRYKSRWGKQPMKYLKDKYQFPVVDKTAFHELFPNSYGGKAEKKKIIIKGLNVKTTLHSPGDIILQIADFFQQNPLLLPICYMAIFGGKVGNYEFNSLLGVIKGFINRKYENDKKAVELRKLSAEADLAEQQALRQKLDNLETMRKLQLSSVDDYAEPLATAAKNLEIQPSSATIIDITEILKSHQEDQQPQ